MKIFYSWQSDLPNNSNRGFIENCIDKTIRKYKDIISIEADRDVQNNTGSPDITNTIFAKINDCDLFIADISIINKSKYKIFKDKSKATPNPNVLLELGYAASVLGWDRIICVYNTDYSGLEVLPFDLRQHRITSYSLVGKKKADVRDSIVNAFSVTIDGLINKGITIRPKGTWAFHRLMGFDIKNNKIEEKLFVAEVESSFLREELVELSRQLVHKLNLSPICFNDKEESEIYKLCIDPFESPIKEIDESEKIQVYNAVKKLLCIDLQQSAFYFGNFKERANYLQGGYYYEGSDEEIQKYENYLLLKRLLTEITILDLFSKSFKDIFMLPLAIKNTSQQLDRNIRVVITIGGDDFELIAPTKDLINNELKGNVGFVCDFGFIPRLFSMREGPEIHYDEDLEYYDYLDSNSRINLWDGGTIYDIDNCVQVLCDYAVIPSAHNVLEFKIKSLQANETKWLDKIALIKINSGKIKLKYSITSDNTDGNVSGIVE